MYVRPSTTGSLDWHWAPGDTGFCVEAWTGGFVCGWVGEWVRARARAQLCMHAGLLQMWDHSETRVVSGGWRVDEWSRRCDAMRCAVSVFNGLGILQL